MTPNPKHDADFPWWLVILATTAAWLFYEVWASDVYSQAMATLSKGIWLTVVVTLVAYGMACALGLALAMAGLSRFVVRRQLARFYIEVIRGVPIIVLLLYVAFVVSPAFVFAFNWGPGPLGFARLTSRAFPLLWRGVLALTRAYSAFQKRKVP